MTTMFKKGDGASVHTDILLEDHMTMISILAYNARPLIYGVIRVAYELMHGVYVSWTMEQCSTSKWITILT